MQRSTRRKEAKRPRTAPGERVYAIGDIHGRFDLLRDLLRRIEAHDRGLPRPERLHVVLLGDIIDRGPQSAQALEFLHDWAQNTRGQVLLQGNHEDLMLRAYDGESRVLSTWLRVGGRETLESFGLQAPPPGVPVEPRFMDDLARALPRDLMNFVRSWPTVARSGDYFFCHAGIRPGVDLDRQSRQDLMWIRNEFLFSRRNHGAVVVHGHSITPEPDVHTNRIGIDTGAYRTGVLTALYLEDGERQIVTTTGSGAATAYEDSFDLDAA